MAYTKTLIGDITEKGVYNPSTVKTQEVAAICDTNFTNIETQLTNIAVEATADLVGGMVTGNTETGIAVTYQDADNTLDFEVAYGTEPGAVASSTSGQAGSADTASRSDHNHDLGAHTHTGVTNGGVLSAYPAQFTALTTLTGSGIAVPADGSGCKLTTTVVDTDKLSTGTVTTAGTGYKVNDILAVAGGSGGQVAVATLVGSTSGVATVTVTTPGTGYSALSGVSTTTTTTRVWKGTAMAALTGASTWLQVLQAINDDIAAVA